ncbi:Hypothetical protein POVR2_LOCUS102 [uncultured virus]|nr:Hypothetical protein POVR2_LOCUS102 [uncultured virus]
MLPFGWIIIESWDKYDANAYAVAGLARQHTTAPITLVSYSKWSHLPYNDSTSVFEANKDIDVSYVKTSISSLASTISEESMYYGREGDFAPLRVRGGVYQPTLAYNSKIHIVVDTLRDTKGRPISKHTSDMRLGSISSGLVYRLGTEAEFAALKDRDPLRVDSSLDEAVIRLKHADLDVYSVLGNNHPQDEIKKILATIEKSGLANKDLDTVIRLRMGISSGLFYVSWTGRGRTSERDRYIAGLIGALIEHPPTYYAPIAAFKPFVGRNDIETLCNVWASLILSHSGPFWSWKREAHISFWCKDNGFNLPAIQKLITNMKRVCLGMKGDIGLFDNIKTQELNIATEVLVEIDRSRQKTNIKWDRSSALPAQSLIHNADILPVLAHGKTLDIYIDKRRLFIKTAIKAESLDLFYGL